jgi:class 3 adenylate cyclase
MALASREETEALAQRWRLRGYDLGVGYGIAAGHATLGRVGFEGRFDYRATGTVVNLASRLCGRAQGGQILLSPRAYSSVTDIVDVENAGMLELKGFHQPVQAYSVVGIKGRLSSAQPSSPEQPGSSQGRS